MVRPRCPEAKQFLTRPTPPINKHKTWPLQPQPLECPDKQARELAETWEQLHCHTPSFPRPLPQVLGAACEEGRHRHPTIAQKGPNGACLLLVPAGPGPASSAGGLSPLLPSMDVVGGAPCSSPTGLSLLTICCPSKSPGQDQGAGGRGPITCAEIQMGQLII